MVEDGEQAAAAVGACRYAPGGFRSVGGLRGSETGEPLCLVMIETRAGVEWAEEIAATPGLDGIYVGPSDLALHLRPAADDPARASAGAGGARDVCARRAPPRA